MKIFYLATIFLMDSVCSHREIPLDEFNQRILDEHNRLRKQVAISDKAADMFKMATDPELVALAKKQVDTCKYGHTYDSSKNYDRIGQNIYRGGGGPERVAKAWFDERDYYTYKSMSCKKGKECGHYTQVVRAETKYIGCASKVCGRNYFASCNYGNDFKVTDHPYKIRDRPCQYCPDNCVETALCNTNSTIILPPEECKDARPSKCRGNYCKWTHKYWALHNCMKFCGFCIGITTKPKECKLTVKGLEYKGTLSHTPSGRKCQQWKLDKPHKSNYKNEDKNYCRNPDKDKRPWCYTTDPDPDMRWEYCDVPLCKTE